MWRTAIGIIIPFLALVGSIGRRASYAGRSRPSQDVLELHGRPKPMFNPAPPDPTQKMIFDWMPLIFTFMLAGFSAGLVIYWAWNNTLSVCQQAFIVNKHGAKIELWDNLKALWGGGKKAGKPAE